MIKKAIIYYNFIVVTTMVVSGFFSTQSSPQLISAILFSPIALYFWLLVVPKKNKAVAIYSTPKLPKTQKPVELKRLPDKAKVDADRRMFLKLIGSAGASLFLFALFTKKAEAAFFGSVPGTGTVALKDTSGTQIDPAIKQPTDGYKISGIDDSSPAYYGFVNKDGDWFIMRETSGGEYKYYKKTALDNDFTTDWPNRATLTPYEYFDSIFS